MTRTQKPTYDVVTPLDVDYLDAFGEATEEDRAHWDRARAYGREVLERIDGHWDRAEYPLDLVARAGELDLLTDGLEVPGHAVMSPLAAAVQGGLVLRALVHCAGPEQKERYLEPVARGTLPGGFALTEPLHGSDSVSLETSARPDGAGGWVLNGAKKWIGNGAAGGITIVWARDTEDGQVKGFVVEQSTPGYEAEVITGKGALRAIHQAEITLTDVRVGDDARLPGVARFKDAARVLVATRVNVGWSALGHATAMFEAALAYARQREQFGKPLGAHQMVQERLAQMLDEVTAMQTRCVAVARLQAAGRLRDEQASLLKYACTRGARRVAQIARDMLGGNGILLEHRVMRHFADVEALHTYEGTESVQALILGRDLTGMSAFA